MADPRRLAATISVERPACRARIADPVSGDIAGSPGYPPGRNDHLLCGGFGMRGVDNLERWNG